MIHDKINKVLNCAVDLVYWKPKHDNGCECMGCIDEYNEIYNKLVDAIEGYLKIKPRLRDKMYQCDYCGRTFKSEVAHRCRGTFRRKNLKFRLRTLKPLKKVDKLTFPERERKYYAIIPNNGSN